MGAVKTILDGEECDWPQAIEAAFGAFPPASVYCTSPGMCIDALSPFMGAAKNHCILPTGEEVALDSVGRSHESGCIEFKTGAGQVAIAKPARLLFEYVKAAPNESFFLLELSRLSPCAIHEAATSMEALTELTPLQYVDADVFDEGYDGFDEFDKPLPLPESARRVTRWLGGKMLIVSKSSRWGQSASPHDSRHNCLPAQAIKKIIEDAL